MSDVTYNCLQTHNPLTAQTQLVTLTDDWLNNFHGFRVTQTLVDHMQRRAGDEEIYPYQFDFHPTIWENIFRYLTVKDIFRFVITVPRWCHSCDLNELRNKYLSFVSTAFVNNFIGVLQTLPANARVKLTAIESTERHPSPKVTAYEALTLNEFILLHEKAASVPHYGKIHGSSTTLRGELDERKDWLTSLQRMDISSTNLKLSDVRDILNLCLQLCDLKICFKDVAVYPLPFTATLKDHVNLERLDLSDVTVCSRNLQLLLEKTPNLRVLLLKNFKMSDEGAMQLMPGSLDHLQKMILQGANFKAPNIHILLMAAPHVNEVDLSCQTFAKENHAIYYEKMTKNHTRLNNSLSALPENSLLSLEMIHISPTFFLSDQLPMSRQTLMTDPRFMLSPAMCEDLVSQCSFTLRDLESLLKAAPNLRADIRALIGDQITLQQKISDIVNADRRPAPAPSAYRLIFKLDQYGEVHEMKADHQKIMEELKDV